MSTHFAHRGWYGMSSAIVTPGAAGSESVIDIDDERGKGTVGNVDLQHCFKDDD
jgi:hypothetical protein